MEKKWVLFLVGGVFLINSTALAVIATKINRIPAASYTNEVSEVQLPASISAALIDIQLQLAQLRGEQMADEVLGTSNIINIDDLLAATSPSPMASPTAARIVTVSNPNFKTVNVYKDRRFSSAVVGQIDYGSQYPYLAKEGTWYQLQLPGNILGWASGQHVKELL